MDVRRAPCLGLAALVLLLGACAGEDAASYDLTGSWHIDFERSRLRALAPDVAAMDRESALAFLHEERGRRMGLEFQETRLLLRGMGDEGEAHETTWRLVSKDGSVWTAVFLRQDGDPETFTLTWEDPDHFVLQREADRVGMVFARR